MNFINPGDRVDNVSGGVLECAIQTGVLPRKTISSGVGK